MTAPRLTAPPPWGRYRRRPFIFLSRLPVREDLRVCMSCGAATPSRPITLGTVEEIPEQGTAMHVGPPSITCVKCLRAHVAQLQRLLTRIDAEGYEAAMDQVVAEVDPQQRERERTAPREPVGA